MSAPQLSLDQIAAGVGQLPSLPVVVMQLLASFEQEQADTADIARRIAQDQALTVKVLRVANSSFYGMQGKIASIQDAMVVLGFRNVRTLVLAASVVGSFPAVQGGWFDQKVFWKHGLAVALAARSYASAAGVNPEHAFTAGLLHDVGRLVLVTCFPEHYRAVVTARAGRDAYLSAIEHEVLGVDHAQVGAVLAERWKFSPQITDAVKLHHAAGKPETPLLATLVHLADVTAHGLDLAGEVDPIVPLLDELAWKRLNIGWPEYKKRLADIEKQHQGAVLMLAA
jgi:putative nucleotidyltransferase with HDIG domain